MRIIDHLRKLFPGKWEYKDGRWYGESFEVYGESWWYNESSGYHTVRYVRNDTGQPIEEIPFREEYCG